MVIRLEPRELADGELRLRPWRAEDVPAIAEACRDPEIARWTRVPDDYTEQDARDFVAASAERRGRGGREGVLRDYVQLKGRRRDCVMFSLLPRDLEG